MSFVKFDPVLPQTGKIDGDKEEIFVRLLFCAESAGWDGKRFVFASPLGGKASGGCRE